MFHTLNTIQYSLKDIYGLKTPGTGVKLNTTSVTGPGDRCQALPDIYGLKTPNLQKAFF
jgi:hypothetical protein